MKVGDLLYHAEAYLDDERPGLVVTEYEVTHAGKTYRVEPAFKMRTVLKDEDMEVFCANPEAAKQRAISERRKAVDRARAAYESAERDLIEICSAEVIVRTREAQKRAHQEHLARLENLKNKEDLL